jgi:hypothetical protein
MVGVVGSSPIAPTKNNKKAAYLSGFFIVFGPTAHKIYSHFSRVECA